ncbi:hypothetical protein TNCT_15471 [Trichonephila clavata]|uniref:Uncharacterized protein n=1 Tax=Trichonephila clavata TaxID=2740835 RepID=A0A8X6HRI8_TRICU|nr:hypothetical protein TNCT_15471 [Trichonephila clavata]
MDVNCPAAPEQDLIDEPPNVVRRQPTIQVPSRLNDVNPATQLTDPPHPNAHDDNYQLQRSAHQVRCSEMTNHVSSAPNKRTQTKHVLTRLVSTIQLTRSVPKHVLQILKRPSHQV